MQKIEAIIFDMDGVISDTQKLHSKVESRILHEHGINVSPTEITDKYAGVKTSEFMGELLKGAGTPFNIDKIIENKWLEMERLANNGVDEIPGSVDLITLLKSEGYALAVASASNFGYVTSVLKNLGIIDLFDTIVSGDMVRRGKPHPETFLLASKRIGVLPGRCLVIEDGRSGMEAAEKAGMSCVGLVKDKEGTYPTSNLVTNLQSITTDYINSL